VIIDLNMNVIWTPDPATAAKLDTILYLLRGLTAQGLSMSKELDTLTAQVKANTDAEQSAILLLTQLSALIKQNATDPAALNALAAELNTSAAALAAAITANTPAP